MKKNIVFLLIDTVRASDAYHNPKLHTINYLYRNGVSYENTVAPGTWTAPTHAALFVNKPVSSIRHVSRDFFKDGSAKIDPWLVKTKFLPKNSITLAGKLSKIGYKSVLFSNNPFISSFTNLGIGFDKLYDLWLDTNVKENKRLAEKLSFILERGASAREKMYKISYLMTRVLPKKALDRLYLYLRKRLDEGVANADGTFTLDRGALETERRLLRYLDYFYDLSPQFIFINYIEAHENYPVRGITQDKWLYLSGIEPLDEYIVKKLHSAYTKRIEYLDRRIGRLITLLKKKGILDNAVLIVASDHGQAFGEHGLLYHSLPPYEPISKVPLLAINFENGKLIKEKEHVENPVSLLSLHDAILGIASGREEHLNGNLRRDRYVFSEHKGISEGWDEQLLRLLKQRSSIVSKIYETKRVMNTPAIAIYKNSIKLVHHYGYGKDELYNLENDPEESDNIIDSNRQLALEMLNHHYHSS